MLDARERAPVLALPGFELYLRRATQAWCAPVENTILNTTLQDLGRFVAGILVLFLDATPGGITLARLSDVLEQTGISSPGRARSMMIFLRFIGYIEPAPETGDSRARRFRPTGRMAAAFRERYRREYEAAAPLDANVAEVLSRLDDPRLFKAAMAAMGELTLAGFQLFEPTDTSLDVISHQYAGMSVLGQLLKSADHENSPFPPVGPVRFAMAGLAKSAGISRPQVRRILQAGAEKGFFELRGEGELVLTPLLAEHVRMLLAATFMMMRWSCARALAEQTEASE